MPRRHKLTNICTLVAFCAAVAACGGGVVGYDNPRGSTATGSSSNSDNTSGGAQLTAASEDADEISIEQDGNVVIFNSPTGSLIAWADLNEGDKLLIGWNGNIYPYTHVLPPPTSLTASAAESSLVMAGDIGPTAEIGFPYITLDGEVTPHILIFNGASGENTDEVSYVFSACATSLCEAGALNETVTTTAVLSPQNFGDTMQIRWTSAESNADGAYTFAINKSVDTAVVDDGSSSDGSDIYDDTPTDDSTTDGDDGTVGNTTSQDYTTPTSGGGGGGGGDDDSWLEDNWGWLVAAGLIAGGTYVAGDAMNWWGGSVCEEHPDCCSWIEGKLQPTPACEMNGYGTY